MSDVEQWINLPREDKYVEDKITALKRLDFIRFKVKFQKAILSGYKVEIRCVGGSDFEDYEATEKQRNINFKLRGMPGVLTNNGETEITCTYDVYLNAAADNQYEIVATHKGKEVTSSFKVKSRKKLFYQVMKMKDCPTTSMAGMETEFWNPGRKHYIEMKKKGAESTVKFIPCLDGTNAGEFIKASAKGYKLKTHKPYAFGITFVNYSATPESLTITREVTFAAPSAGQANHSWEVSLSNHLWYELDPKDDKKKRFFRQIRLWFEPDDTAAATQVLTIKKAWVEPSGPKTGAFGGRTKLKFTVKLYGSRRRFFSQTNGKWKIQMELVCVRGFQAGFAYNDINLIAICTKTWWDAKDLGSAVQVVVHEVGHKVGMVAHGDKPAYGSTPALISASAARKSTLPNSHPNLYGDVRGTNDQDHMGPHCTKGAAWDRSKPRGQRWSGSPGCTMFGATAIAGNAAPVGFCSDCSKLVRKLDLTGPALKLGGFKVSMDEYK